MVPKRHHFLGKMAATKIVLDPVSIMAAPIMVAAIWKNGQRVYLPSSALLKLLGFKRL